MARLSKTTLMGFLLFLSACTSSKVLNESRAKALIGEALQKESYMTSAGSITPLMSRSTTDYRTAPEMDQLGFRLKRLIEEKLLTEKVEVLTYPKVSGTFVCRWGGNLQTEFLLTPVNDNYIMATGKFGFTTGPPSWTPVHNGGWGSPWMTTPTPARGTVNTDGLVHFPSPQILWKYWLPGANPIGAPGGRDDVKLRYREEGTSAYLRVDGTNVDFTGTASREKITLKWYEYTFSPEVQKSAGPQGIEVAAGRYQVGDVSNLQLVNETHATANFAWQAQLNKLGQIMLGDAKPSGASTVQFAKKPDGTWVIPAK